MNKEELRELAHWGARRKLESLERELGALYKEFPDVFLSDGPPLLVKAERREAGTNGSWPTTKNNKISATWTPERRAKQAKRMRTQQGERMRQLAKKKRKLTTAKATRGQKTPKQGWKDLWYDRLTAVGGKEQLGETARALKTKAANLLTGASSYLEAGIIKRTGKGTYIIGAPRPS